MPIDPDSIRAGGPRTPDDVFNAICGNVVLLLQVVHEDQSGDIRRNGVEATGVHNFALFCLCCLVKRCNCVLHKVGLAREVTVVCPCIYACLHTYEEPLVGPFCKHLCIVVETAATWAWQIRRLQCEKLNISSLQRNNPMQMAQRFTEEAFWQ